MDRRFLKFRYAAIRRHGERRWTAKPDVIEFNLGNVVGISGCERHGLDYGLDRPYLVELSNGTKFLCYMHAYGDGLTDEMLSDMGEAANSCVDEGCYEHVKRNIYRLNGGRRDRDSATRPGSGERQESVTENLEGWELI